MPHRQRQWPPAGLIDAGPVAYCGQQKAGDHRRGIAEQHFVRMPADRAIIADAQAVPQPSHTRINTAAAMPASKKAGEIPVRTVPNPALGRSFAGCQVQCAYRSPPQAIGWPGETSRLAPYQVAKLLTVLMQRAKLQGKLRA
jgi:hypothetical protein